MARDWTPIRPLIRSAEEAFVRRAADDARYVAGTDQGAARLRDELDSRGVNVADPDELHTGMMFLNSLVATTQRAVQAGHVPSEHARTTYTIAISLVSFLLDHVPKEVRHG